MRSAMKRPLAYLPVFVLITVMSAAYAAGIPQMLAPPHFEERETSNLLSFKAVTAGDGMEPILLARARPTPPEKPKPKKPPKTIGPGPGNGCGGDGNLLAGTGDNITINQPCKVGAGTYNYGFVNIYGGGSLTFTDATIDFWAKSILVENQGSLIVGSSTDPIGNTNPANTVTFHLFGDNNTTSGITCVTPNCGVADNDWTSSPAGKIILPSGVTDFFYKYQRLPADDNKTGGLAEDSYFGLKTLAVSYGGALQMFGNKGAVYQDPDPYDDGNQSRHSGMSWVRLNQNVCPPDSSLNPDCKSMDKTGKQLVLDRFVNWQPNDWIVVTATDYIPAHSEMVQIDSIQTVGHGQSQYSVITLKTAVNYPHNGQPYDLAQHQIPERLNDYGENFMKSVDTRAAVALLTRNIRIVSEGASSGEPLPDPTTPGSGKYFGGHVIARQGFKQFQMKGVELKQLGQGGRMAHSPVNFHMARQVPTYGSPNITYVTACSANESMTRMFEIRGTQGVILKRNVGYKSIGQGYYLAEGTETGNDLVANIGIYARPAVDYRDNPRKAPGILASSNAPRNFAAFATDYIHPSVFYIANGYNSFEDNMAVGAGTCGACYWIAPVKIGGLSLNQSWESYAGIQRNTPGAAPLYRFHGNYCSTAQHSLITIDSPGVCQGVSTRWQVDSSALQPIYSPFEASYQDQGLYPNIALGAFLQPTTCSGTDCTNVLPPCGKGQTQNCAVNVIDSYTSSFHWAQQNYAAIWLRTFWFLFTNSALTDVLNGGLTMVSGGSWDQVINKYWALTRKSVFIGNTQTDKENIYAQNRGPVNSDTSEKLVCMPGTPASYCRVQDGQGNDEGIVIPADNFSVYQRLYNIYDGPVYQESNAFLNIKKREVTGCSGGTCTEKNFLYWRTPGILKATEDPLKGKCVMPNAAIGWKQPNGFYYPPAFHSRNLFFDDVDIRHFVIVPLFNPGTYDGNATAIQRLYCTYPGNQPEFLFNTQFTDIDRQTELNDDDGSISGLSGAEPQQIADTNGTVSVNRDQFYYAPKSPFECLSEQSCYQSPHDYVSAVVFPKSHPDPPNDDNWSIQADNSQCYGVPIYRQYLNFEKGEKPGEEQGIRMLGAEIYQRSTMITNKGKYYIDTAASAKKQGTGYPPKNPKNVFLAGHTYYFFLIYAKDNTNVTFQLYVGKAADVSFDNATDVEMVRVGNDAPDGKVLHNWNSDDFFLSQSTWPSGWSRNYDRTTGILEVKMDLGQPEFTGDFRDAAEESCGPPSFCEWKEDDNKCGCKDYPDPSTSPIGFRCQDSVCAWSSLRPECPSGGCYGFQVTFPPGFVADDNSTPTAGSPYVPLHRPAPEPFPAEWKVKWEKAEHPLAFDANVPWDQDVYPPPGPCDYSNQDPGDAPLPGGASAASTRAKHK
jgi:hypothetical protein